MDKIKEQLRATLTAEQLDIIIPLLETLPTDFQKAAFARLIIDVINHLEKGTSKPTRFIPNNEKNILIQIMSLFIPQNLEQFFLCVYPLKIGFKRDEFAKWAQQQVMIFQDRELISNARKLIDKTLVPAKNCAEDFRNILINLIKGDVYTEENYSVTCQTLIPYFIFFYINTSGKLVSFIILEKDETTGKSAYQLACDYGDQYLIGKIREVLGEKGLIKFLPTDNHIFYTSNGTPQGYVYQSKQVYIENFKTTSSDLPKTVEEFHTLIKLNWGVAVELTFKFPQDIIDLYNLENKYDHLFNNDDTLSKFYYSIFGKLGINLTVRKDLNPSSNLIFAFTMLLGIIRAKNRTNLQEFFRKNKHRKTTSSSYTASCFTKIVIAAINRKRNTNMAMAIKRIYLYKATDYATPNTRQRFTR